VQPSNDERLSRLADRVDLVGTDAPDRPPLFPTKGKQYAVLMGGRYLDRFESRKRGWRIARRVLYFDWHFTSEEPSIQLLPLGARDGGFGASMDWLRR
jgi:hypothetical protein